MHDRGQDGARAHVLMAVDAPMIARILADKLRREGHAVTCVSDAAAARATLERGAVDVLLLDPSLGGVDAARHASRGWFAVVDSRDQGSAHAAMLAGAAGLVRLPFKPTDVAAQVETLLHVTSVAGQES